MNKNEKQPDRTTMVLCESWLKLYIDWSAKEARYKKGLAALRRAAYHRLTDRELDTVETHYGKVQTYAASVSPKYPWAVIDLEAAKLAEATTRLEALLNTEQYFPLRQSEELTAIIADLRNIQAAIADSRNLSIGSAGGRFYPEKEPPAPVNARK